MRDIENKRQYERTYHLNRYKERMSAAKKLLGGRCKICGSKKGLQLDHIDRSTKSFTLGSLWSVSKKRFDAELQKCQLLCRSCHQTKTRSELISDHGTYGRYKRGCRCVACTDVVMTYSREYKRKRRIKYLESLSP